MQLSSLFFLIRYRCLSCLHDVSFPLNLIRIFLCFFLSITVTGMLVPAQAQILSQSSAASAGAGTNTSTIGSFISLSGQVVAPKTSASYGSTYGLSAGDQVQWTNFYASHLSGPYTISGTQFMPDNYTWVQGSVLAPPNTAMKWMVNGAWVNSEPGNGAVVTQVQWGANPLQVASTVILPTAGSFSGTGDGFRMIPYGNNLYVLNHHSAGPFLNCRVIATMLPCSNFPAEGLKPGAPAGKSILNWNDGYSTPYIPMEALNLNTGELFVGEMWDGPPMISCTNLNTLTSCGVFPVPNQRVGGRIADIGQLGNKYYTVSDMGQLSCFDIISKTACGTYQYPPVFDVYNSFLPLIFAGKLFYEDGSSRVLRCHDPSVNQPCSGWTTDGNYLTGTAMGLYPMLNADGSPQGVCTGSTPLPTCFTMSGVPYSPSANFTAFLKTYGTWNNYTMNISGILDTRIFIPMTNGMSCYNFATDAGCSGWPLGTEFATVSYSTIISPLYPTCVMLLGDKSIGLLYDANTGINCTGKKPEAKPEYFDVNPASYYLCDPTKANITAWDLIRLTPSVPWGSGLSSVTVTLSDGNGVQLPADFNPVRKFTTGSYSLSIADIPYARYPRLRVSMAFNGVNGGSLGQKLSVDVTWKGGPYQICFQTKTPGNPGCTAGTTLTVNAKKVDSKDGVYEETLTTGMNMSSAVASSGYAAVSASTTARSVLATLADGTPQTQVLQGRWSWANFSGDLWSFSLSSDSSFNLAPAKASASITASASRPLYSASPADKVNGAMGIYPLSYANASASQKIALNTNIFGTADKLGEQRISYLTGTDGAFRPRSGGVLGPVINSGPVVLPMAPQASLSEANHPGYTAYLNDSAKKRPNPLALFGSNDGALHAISVQEGKLSEAWSFYPDVMLRATPRYTDTTLLQIQANPYFVDNVPMTANVDTGSDKTPDWRAIAVITYGAGARAVTALDVTYNTLTKGKGVLFEYTNNTKGTGEDGVDDLADLGTIRSQPISDTTLGSQQIVKLNDGRWAVLVGNGVNANAGTTGMARAVLYAFYLDGGSPRWRRYAVDALFANADKEPLLTAGNGLSTPRPVDINGDGKADVVYAGDMQGNLWRFDLTKVTAPVVTRLYQTPGGAAQPIQAAPLAIRNAASGACTAANSSKCFQLVFGTGLYASPLDNSSVSGTEKQLLVSILDKGDSSTVAQSQLVQQNYSPASSLGVNFRTAVPSGVNYSSNKRGWFTILGTNEQVVGASSLTPVGLAMIPVVKPASGVNGVCTSPGSWLYALSPLYGTTPSPVFDVNGDGIVNNSDVLMNGAGTQVYPSAMAVSGAQYLAPSVLLNSKNNSTVMSLLFPGLGQDQGVASNGGWNASIGAGNGGKTSGPATVGTPKNLGRLSWREVYQ